MKNCLSRSHNFFLIFSAFFFLIIPFKTPQTTIALTFLTYVILGTGEWLHIRFFQTGHSRMSFLSQDKDIFLSCFRFVWEHIKFTGFLDNIFLPFLAPIEHTLQKCSKTIFQDWLLKGKIRHNQINELPWTCQGVSEYFVLKCDPNGPNFKMI